MSATPAVGDLATWRSLVETESRRAFVDQVSSSLGTDGTPDPCQISSWRKSHDGDTVRAAIDLVRGRRSAAPKFRVPEPVVDRSGAEQASAWPVAAWKAARFAGLTSPVTDLCCGAGSDACEFARAGIAVRGIDLDPVRAWMCAVNAGCDTVVGDVADEPTAGLLVHLDPSRRDEPGSGGGRGQRHHALDALRPSFETVCTLTDAASGAGVKLAPGIDPDPLLTHDPSSLVSYVSLGGRMREGVWWRGALAGADAPVEAVVLNDRGEAAFVSGTPASPDVRARIGGVIYTVDPAIERARLLGVLAATTGLSVVHPALGLLTGDGPPVAHGASTAFVVDDVLPWRRDRVRSLLKARGAGIVEVKTRGKACDPDVEQRFLRGPGSDPYTVFVFRFDEAVRAIIARRVRNA